MEIYSEKVNVLGNAVPSKIIVDVVSTEKLLLDYYVKHINRLLT